MRYLCVAIGLGLASQVAPVLSGVLILDTAPPAQGGAELSESVLTEWIRLPAGGVVFGGIFGFETAEIPADNVILDSVTLTLVDPESGGVAILATLDAAGLILRPEAPGAISLTSASIQYALVEAPIPSELGGWQAFEIRLELPEELQGRPLDFYFDLVSNQDGTRSRGFVANVAVPESRRWGVGVGIGLAAWAAGRRVRRG